MTDRLDAALANELKLLAGRFNARGSAPADDFVRRSLELTAARGQRQRRAVAAVAGLMALVAAGLFVGLRGSSVPIDRAAVEPVPSFTVDGLDFLDALPTLAGDAFGTAGAALAAFGVVWVAISAFRRRRMSRPLPRWAVVLLAVLGLLLTIAIGLRMSISVFMIPSESMAPSISAGERVVVATNDTDVQVGDVVIHRVEDRSLAHAIKRVVAVGGDVVAIDNGKLLVNGTPSMAILVDPNVPVRPTNIGTLPMIVSDGALFVMGDNYNNSFDSRAHGEIDETDIVGTVRWASGGNLRLVES